MAILSIEIPDDVARRLQPQVAEMTRLAMEEIALAGYRSGTLSQFQVQAMLGFGSTWETQEWLGSRGAVMRYGQADLDLDRQNLDRLLGPSG